MKFLFFYVILITLINIHKVVSADKQFDFTNAEEEEEEETCQNEADSPEMPQILSNPDKVLERIRDNMWDIALEMSSHPNIKRKKLELGILPDEYPAEMKERAKRVRQNKSEWENIMLHPTAVWRMCLFPNFKINYVSWCKQKLALTKTKIKLTGCLNNFCLVCCDHLQLHFKEIAKENDLGDKFSLDTLMGYENIKYIVNDKEINECRAACKAKYKLEMPYILPTPPRDPTLGATIANPATSCADIKKWGMENAKSGEYWLELASKGKQKAFCDMEADNGGWTLFYNYKHLPGQELVLDSSRLPTNLQENSHMYLSNAGFTHQDVKEVRFLCTEKFRENKFYWHFKTDSKDFIKVALTGDQETFRLKSLSESYIELPPLSQINGVYKKRVFETMTDNIDFFGISPDGGFHNTPFGLTKYRAYWTIRGSSLSNPKYECATAHNYVGGYASPEYSPNMVESHHTVWFRGDPPCEDFVKRRLLTRIRSDPS